MPFAPIVRPDQLLDDPHLKASGGLARMTTEDGGVTDVVLLPLLMDGRRPGVRRPLPRIGEHTSEVLADLEHGIRRDSSAVPRPDPWPFPTSNSPGDSS